MKYNRKSNDKYVKQNIPHDRLEQFVKDIQIDLIKEIENKAELLIFEHIEKYGVEIIEGNSEAFDELRVWLASKKVEINSEVEQ